MKIAFGLVSGWRNGLCCSRTHSGPAGTDVERAWNRRREWQAMGKAARARVEQLIPRDPIGDFCELLVECATE